MRYAQLVIGPAGCGKSTYCNSLVQYGEDIKRSIKVVNLDPAADYFQYTPLVDVRELIHVQDTMEDEEYHFGPNGGLVFCFEYLLNNSDWLREQLGDQDNDYILFDCPGQIELYTHLTAMKNLAQQLQAWNFNLCVVYLVDVQFMTDGPKFLSGAMSALSVMINIELPHVNILSKMDLLSEEEKNSIDTFLVPDTGCLLLGPDLSGSAMFNAKYQKLTQAIAQVIENYSMVRFIPLNVNCNESIGDVLMSIDHILQFVDVQEVNPRDIEEV